MQKYYSDDWQSATTKFTNNARKFGDVKWCVANNHKYDIPYVSIGDGPNKVVIYSGIGGLDAFYGSAAQNMFLDEFAPLLTQKMLEQYTIVLIHVVNGWGMDNKMHEVLDQNNKLVDLVRNFLPDFSKLPHLDKHYKSINDLFVSKPNRTKLKNISDAINCVKVMNMGDYIDVGQYENSDWLFYGGNKPTVENRMLTSIYKKILQGATSVKNINLRIDGGVYNLFCRNTGLLRVRHNVAHPSTVFYKNICGWTAFKQVANAKNGAFSDKLESDCAAQKLPIYSADFCIENNIHAFDELKCKNMGDAKYEFNKYGAVSDNVTDNLMKLFCPADRMWRESAMRNTYNIFRDIQINLLQKCK